jgi:hypothetical protein
LAAGSFGGSPIWELGSIDTLIQLCLDPPVAYNLRKNPERFLEGKQQKRMNRFKAPVFSGMEFSLFWGLL